MFKVGKRLPTGNKKSLTLESPGAKFRNRVPPSPGQQGLESDFTLATVRRFMPSPRERQRSIGERTGIEESCEARNPLIRQVHSRSNGTLGNRNRALIGAAEGTRTPDPRITNALLYQLSYCGDVKSICTILRICSSATGGISCVRARERLLRVIFEGHFHQFARRGGFGYEARFRRCSRMPAFNERSDGRRRSVSAGARGLSSRD